MKKSLRILDIEKKIGESLKEYLVRQYWENHKSTTQIGLELEINPGTVGKWFKKYSIEARNPSEAKLPGDFIVPSKETLERLYVTERKTTSYLAKQFQVSHTTISGWLSKNNITIRNPTEAHLRKGLKKPSKSELRRLYIEEHLSTNKIADQVGVSSFSVCKWLREYHIPIRKPSESVLPKDFKKPKKEVMERLYIEERKSGIQIAKIFGVSQPTIYDLLDKYHIPRREGIHTILPEIVVPTREQLQKWYSKEERSLGSISEEVGVSRTTVRSWLKNKGIPLREKFKGMLQKGFTKPAVEKLRRWYIDERKSVNQISQELGVSQKAVNHWLSEIGVEIRGYSEAKLSVGVKKPSREKLEQWYVKERESMIELSKRIGVTDATLRRWIREYEIPLRDKSEEVSAKKPAKEELERWYIRDQKSTVQIGKMLGISSKTVGRWLKDYDVLVRNNSESHLIGRNCPSQEELVNLYLHENQSLDQIAKTFGVHKATVSNWLERYKIEKSSKIKDGEGILNFLKKEKSALELSLAVLNLNREGSDIEKLITQLYEDRINDSTIFHELLAENRENIRDLVREGITNLGTYLGDYTLEDRVIVPLLIGQALSGISGDRLTISLEERIVKILRNEYGPAFNINPEGTLSRLEKTINQYEGKVRGIYQRLYNHYSETMNLMEELK